MGWYGLPEPPFYPSAYHTARDRLAVNHILDGVYITNFKGADDREQLRALGVTHMASVGNEFVGKEHGDGFTHWDHDITDDEHQGEVMGTILHEAADFIESGLQSGGKVLVHCAAGISRSASVVLGWMVLHRGLTLRAAFEQLFSARPCVWPNEGFMAALSALEVETRGGASTLPPDEYAKWGDWEGAEEPHRPELAGGSSSEGVIAHEPSSFMPRLNREETCLEAEERELAALDEDSERRHNIELAALLGRGGTSDASTVVAEQESSESSPPQPPTAVDRAPPRRLGGGLRRLSLSRGDRREQAARHSEQAANSRRESEASLRSNSDRPRLGVIARRVALVLRWLPITRAANPKGDSHAAGAAYHAPSAITAKAGSGDAPPPPAKKKGKKAKAKKSKAVAPE